MGEERWHSPQRWTNYHLPRGTLSFLFHFVVSALLPFWFCQYITLVLQASLINESYHSKKKKEDDFQIGKHNPTTSWELLLPLVSLLI